MAASTSPADATSGKTPPVVGFWARYHSSLKPLAVEEPIDVGWHRLLGYGVARAALPTPISADAITIFSILVGFASGLCIALPFAHHLVWGAALCTLSAVFDCADGQLARMRQKSSNFGRMLDGVADTLVMAAIVAGAIAYLLQKGEPWWFWPFAIATLPICTFHFGHYDHYKNTYLRLTEPKFREGEDVEGALESRKKDLEKNPPGIFKRFAWWLYIYYVTSQTNYIRATDPYTSTRLGLMPPYDARNAEIYRRHNLGPMRLWRTHYGLGTHVFTFSLACAFDKFEWYVVWRFGVLNAINYGFAIWYQRRASKAAFEEMGLRLPAQRGWDDARRSLA